MNGAESYAAESHAPTKGPNEHLPKKIPQRSIYQKIPIQVPRPILQTHLEHPRPPFHIDASRPRSRWPGSSLAWEAPEVSSGVRGIGDHPLGPAMT